jgi:cyclopropane fatty-acyl-phospholipid synthase-like methyltransferase
MSNYTDAIAKFYMENELSEKAINEVTTSVLSIGEDSLPPLNFMNIIGSDGVDHFLANSVSFFTSMVRRFHLTKSSNILDLGTGCGRLAIPFYKFLDDGQFYGVDVWKEGVDWCKNYLNSENFHFYNLESRDNYYFSDEKNVSNGYSLNFIPDKHIDFGFAISVFTHLRADDCLAYLREISRCLKPGGTALITCFIIDEYFNQYKSITGNFLDVEEKDGGCYQAYSGQDFFAGFTYDRWREMIEISGLKVVSFQLGSWARKPGAQEYQDSFIVKSSM